MSSYEKLRHMLDECGVEHQDHYLSTTWRDKHGILHLADVMLVNDLLVVDNLTPVQAIAATVGVGKLIEELVKENAILRREIKGLKDGVNWVDKQMEIGRNMK